MQYDDPFTEPPPSNVTPSLGLNTESTFWGYASSKVRALSIAEAALIKSLLTEFSLMLCCHAP